MKSRFTIALLFALAGIGGWSPVLGAPAARPPNILVILADDLGYGDVGCYNPESKVPTTHIDRLAREGMRFTDAHSPSTVCTPTRYSLLTGQMAFRIHYRSVFEGVGGPCLIKEKQLTLPQMLRERGYATALMGKWHVGISFLDKAGQRITKGGIEGVKLIDYSRAIPDAPVHRGFDRFFGTVCCPATDYLYAFIDGDRVPVPPTGVLDKSKLPKHPYANDNRVGMIAPDFDLEEMDMVFLKKSREFLEAHVQSQPEKPFFLLHSMAAAHLPSFPAPQFKGRTKAGPHGDFIFELDHIVGELLQTLEKLGVADNTLVIFTSDNGPETTSVVHMRADYGHDGARPWRGVKRDQWEGGHRVPFIARWPGQIAPGSTTSQTISLTDIMATCAAMTGATLPENAAEDSVNILPVLLGQDGGKPVRDFTLQQTISLALAIRQGPWKYLDHRGSGGNGYDKGEMQPFALPDAAPTAPGQLYNLDTDPGETNNLYFKHPDIVRKLKALLERSKSGGLRNGRSELKEAEARKLPQAQGWRARWMFQDEARFGPDGPSPPLLGSRQNPPVMSHGCEREFTYGYGALSPLEGDFDYRVCPKMNTEEMSGFLHQISGKYPDEFILMVLDAASSHKAKALEIPGNIHLIPLPADSPQLNPQENVWEEIREKNFPNRVFPSMEAVREQFDQGLSAFASNPRVGRRKIFPNLSRDARFYLL